MRTILIKTLGLALLHVSFFGVGGAAAQTTPDLSHVPFFPEEVEVDRDEIFLPSRTPLEIYQMPENWARIVEFLRHYYRIHQAPQSTRDQYVIDDEGIVRFRLSRAIPFELVDEDEEYFYVRQLPVWDPRSAGARSFGAMLGQMYNDESWREYLEDKLLFDPETFVPPGFVESRSFEDFSTGLPTGGLWQYGSDLADFDGDGRPDLVLPPARHGDGRPYIFLQNPRGWHVAGADWPEDLKLDYGDVVVADFDGDGNLDLALACHFTGTFVLYGDGAGNFERYTAMPRLPTTSVALAAGDLTGNGLPDLVALNEIDIDQRTVEIKTSFLLTAFLNPGDRGAWRAVDVSAGQMGFFGNSVALVDLDGDGALDVAISSMKPTLGLFFLNRDNGQRWEVVESTAFPFRAWFPSVAALPGAGDEPDGVAMGAYQRIPQGGFMQHANALITVRRSPRFDPESPSDPEGWDVHVVNLFEGDFTRYTAVAAGDLTGNGEPDLVAGRQDGKLEVYLRYGDDYLREMGPGLDLGEGAGQVHSLQLVDLDGDGLDDIVAVVGGAGEVAPQVRAFLTRPR